MNGLLAMAAQDAMLARAAEARVRDLCESVTEPAEVVAFANRVLALLDGAE